MLPKTLSHSTLRCLICDLGVSKTEILVHLEKIHDLSVEAEKLEFESIDKVHEWKKELEKNTNVSYILQQGVKKSKKYKIHYFTCHRSGNFKTKKRP